MSCRVSLVRYASAAGALDRVVRELQRADPLTPVTVVVSSRRIAYALRHSLARERTDDGRSGIANVRFLTLADLADELGGTASRAGGRRRLTRSALGGAARVVLASDAGVLFAVAEQPSTEAELVALYEELRHSGGEVLEDLARRGAFCRELARLCRSMRANLETDWYDDADLIEAAIEAIEATGAADVIGRNVVVHLPERAESDECRLVAAIAHSCNLVIHVGTTGDVVADSPSWRVLEALRNSGLNAPFSLRAADEERTILDDTVNVTERIEAPDVDAEVRAALRIVIDHIEHGGAPTRVAVLYPSAQTYLAALAAALDEADIAWNGPSPRRVAESAAARALLGIVELTEHGLARDRLMGWINSAPIVDANGRPVPAGAFERVSRLAGVTAGGVAEWHRHLRQLITDRERRVAALDREISRDEGVQSRGSRAVADLAAAIALDAFIDEVARTCDDAMACRAWSELEAWARRVLRRYLAWTDELENDREGTDARIDVALAELGRLDSIEPVASIAAFGRALAATLERTSTYEGRLSYGVAVRSLWGAVGLDFDLAVVLGGVEGELPPRARSSPLLSSDDRAALGLEAATSEAVSAAARHALVAVADAARRTVCTWRLRDSGDGRARVRSRFFGHDEVVLAPSQVASLTSVANGDRTAIGTSELVVSALRARRLSRHELGSFHLVRSDADLQAAMSALASRTAHRFDRFDGRIGVVAEFGSGRVLSPTTLEAYATCPFRYFLSSELGVEFVEEPERRTVIDRRERGSIVHEILERFVADVMNADGNLASVDTPKHLEDVAEGVFERFERLGRTGAAVLWARERRDLLALLERERVADATRRVTERRHPLALEWIFGAEDVPPLEIPLRSGSVAFRGKVDRIDRRSDGALSVIDYKTGGASAYEGLVDDPVDGGHHLQLAIYALAASSRLDPSAPVSSSYRFLDEGGMEQAVVLDDELVARTSEVVGILADGIQNGMFPYNPGEASWQSFANCKFCDFKWVCPPDRDDFWEQASKEPDLASYVELVGGGEDE